MTAADVAGITGLGRATISTTLSRLARSGEVSKAERGYQLPGAGSTSGPGAKPRAPRRLAAPGAKSTRTPRSNAARPRSRAGAGAGAAKKEPARTTPGATKAKVLAALSADRGLTAGEVAVATGLGRATVSTTLSKLAKGDEVVKAERGYRLSG